MLQMYECLINKYLSLQHVIDKKKFAHHNPGDNNAGQKAMELSSHEPHRSLKSDVILALGSHDLRVATRAAQLYLDGWAPLLVCSGGLGNLTSGIWTESEADKFAAIADSNGRSCRISSG